MAGRTLNNTGTCSVCAKNVKLRRGKIMDHGYRRFGFGHNSRSCDGVSFEPYERGTQGCEAYLQLQLEFEARTIAELQRIQTPGFCGKVSVRHGRQTLMVLASHAQWSAALDEAINRLNAELAEVQRVVDIYTKKIASWKPGQPMPSEQSSEQAQTLAIISELQGTALDSALRGMTVRTAEQLGELRKLGLVEPESLELTRLGLEVGQALQTAAKKPRPILS